MSGIISKLFSILMYLSGVLWLVNLYNRSNGKVPVLMYHRILENHHINGTKTCLSMKGMVVNKAVFERHIKYISRHYDVVSTSEYVNSRRMGRPLPANPLILTFDDGFKDNHVNALPVLEKYQCKATFFVIGNACNDDDINLHRLYYLLDKLGSAPYILNAHDDNLIKIELSSEKKKKDFISWTRKIIEENGVRACKVFEQLEELCLKDDSISKSKYKSEYMNEQDIAGLIAGGHEIGGHSMSHRSLGALKTNEKMDEIYRIRLMLDRFIGNEELPFAYPYGQWADFDEEIIEILKKNRFSCGFTTIEGVNDKNSDLYRLHRIEVGEYSICELLVHIAGIVAFMKLIIKRIIRKR